MGLAYAGWKMPKKVGTLSANLPDKPNDLSHSNRDHDPILLGHSLPVIRLECISCIWCFDGSKSPTTEQARDDPLQIIVPHLSARCPPLTSKWIDPPVISWIYAVGGDDFLFSSQDFSCVSYFSYHLVVVFPFYKQARPIESIVTIITTCYNHLVTPFGHRFAEGSPGPPARG